MPWSTEGPDRFEAVAYTRDYSASSVFDELNQDGGANFSAIPEHIEYYGPDAWKVYKITIIIEPN